LNLGLKALLDPSVKKIAIANPLHGPYGQAAVAAMQKKGIYEKAREKFVLGENISQTASFVNVGLGRYRHSGSLSRVVSKHEGQGPLRRGPCG
jgi:ABC-type molybdate transport system substrate-binding protein